MSATDDRLEILIGKLLDGEISPAEQRILDRQLEQDGRARELLGQLRVLRECGREIVEQEVRQGGADPQDVFERAWRQSRGSTWGRIVRLDGLPRFAVGLAAGFLLGLALHFVLVGDSKPTVDDSVVARKEGPADVGVGGRNGGWPVLERQIPNQVTREVEWYGFTDQAGNDWLIEGYREGVARPASYDGGL
jgi:anti-sigma factor RsiW